jgi:hypothetical protein
MAQKLFIIFAAFFAPVQITVVRREIPTPILVEGEGWAVSKPRGWSS